MKNRQKGQREKKEEIDGKKRVRKGEREKKREGNREKKRERF